jgi:hypothetical protein
VSFKIRVRAMNWAPYAAMVAVFAATQVWVWGCGGDSFAQSPELEHDGGGDATVLEHDSSDSAELDIRPLPGPRKDGAELGADHDAIASHDASSDVAGDELDAEASAPPPLICKSIDGQGQCGGPWPFPCCRSSPCECCNYPNCGRD